MLQIPHDERAPSNSCHSNLDANNAFVRFLGASMARASWVGMFLWNKCSMRIVELGHAMLTVHLNAFSATFRVTSEGIGGTLPALANCISMSSRFCFSCSNCFFSSSIFRMLTLALLT
mmetsp:Transcript_21665/g.59536  ORF Transcript_21665/g.59536 Transcript_21665/m.59536 type:complete len:118 (-) Transcript_21665:367-720(-)